MASGDEKGAAGVLPRLLAILEGSAPPGNPSHWRRGLTEWPTTRATSEIPTEAWPLLDEIWSREAREKPLHRAADLLRLTSNGNRTKAAAMLGIGPATLFRKLKALAPQ
jgi:DNA-binding NtrC family response regulator